MASITVTNAGLNLIRNSMSNTDDDAITYVALGTSNTAPTVTDVTLGNEVFRKKITSYTVGVTGEVLINCYIAPGDAIGVVIAEIGFIGGNAATSAPNTGVLFAHGLYSHTKTNIESLQIQADIII